MLDLAKTAALEAGKILNNYFRNVPQDAIRKKIKNDFLSFVDEKAEEAILSIIKDRYPKHAFLAEETGKSNHSNEFEWIIDPLDGTTNYINGIPVFAVSIGLKHLDELILGVIYDPVHDELFWAEKGNGAYLNGRKIIVSQKKSLTDAFIATGFPFKAKRFLQSYLQAFEDIFVNCVGQRRIGAAAIDLAYVAAGRFDGFWEIGLSPWDFAAAAVIIKEAGGHVTDFWNSTDFLYKNYIIATNGYFHDEFCSVVRKYFPHYVEVYPK